MNVPFVVVAGFAGRIQRRFGPRDAVVTGALLAGLGTFGFAVLSPASSFAAAVPSYLLVGLGYGLAVRPCLGWRWERSRPSTPASPPGC
jgi:MFS family permease